MFIQQKNIITMGFNFFSPSLSLSLFSIMVEEFRDQGDNTSGDDSGCGWGNEEEAIVSL